MAEPTIEEVRRRRVHSSGSSTNVADSAAQAMADAAYQAGLMPVIKIWNQINQTLVPVDGHPVLCQVRADPGACWPPGRPHGGV